MRARLQLKLVVAVFACVMALLYLLLHQALNAQQKLENINTKLYQNIYYHLVMVDKAHQYFAHGRSVVMLDSIMVPAPLIWPDFTTTNFLLLQFFMPATGQTIQSIKNTLSTIPVDEIIFTDYANYQTLQQTIRQRLQLVTQLQKHWNYIATQHLRMIENIQRLFLATVIGQILFISTIIIIPYMNRNEQEKNILLQKNTSLKAIAIQAENDKQLKSNLLATLSHEIRTPLNGVLGMLSLLMLEKLAPTARQYTQYAQQAAEMLLTILNDVLDLSKIEAGKLDLEQNDIDIQKIVSEVMTVAQTLAATKNLRVECQVHPTAAIHVIGDRLRVQQIMLNFLTNAIKFTQRGGVRLTIKVLNQDGDPAQLLIRVVDTGTGIAADKIAQLFARFSQTDTDAVRRYNGTGLGLALCRELAHLMNGQVGVRSKLGLGSIFWCLLPLPLLPDGKPHEALWQVAPQLSPDLRVAVVDDNTTSRELVLAQLRYLGLRGEGFMRSGDFLQALQRSPYTYAAVFLDARLAELTDDDIVRTLKTNAHWALMPVMMLAADPTPQKRLQAQQWHASGYLAKPLTRAQIQKTLACLRAFEKGMLTPYFITDSWLKNVQMLAAPAAPQQTPPVVLLVEDNQTNMLLLKTLTERCGATTLTAPSIAAAVALAQRHKIDLALLDYHLPDGNALTLLAQLQRLIPTAPMVIITGMDTAVQHQELLANGAQAVLLKPIREDTIRALLLDFLDYRALA